MSTLTIARLTFYEAGQRKILLAALLMGIAFLLIFGIGFHYLLADIKASRFGGSPLEINEASNLIMMAGMYVVNFLTIMMTVLTSVDTLSGEISTGTIHTVVSKPVRRWEVVAGKWLGFCAMLTLYLLLMGGGVLLAVRLIAGYSPPHPWMALSLMWLNAMLLLTVSLLGGTFLSTLANGVLVFSLYGIAFIGGWIEQIGSVLANITTSQTAINIGILTSLIMPSEALWRRAAYEIQSPLVASLGFSPFASSSVPSPAMVIYAVLYLLAALFLALRQFGVRDL